LKFGSILQGCPEFSYNSVITSVESFGW
jgi:hypothetical protein